MAVGPEARRMASGRIVALGAVDATIGVAAVVLGLGPILEGADASTQLIGAFAVVIGVVLLLAAVSLVARRGPARMLGRIGAWGAIALGVVIALAALASIGECADAASAFGCATVIGGSGLLGAAVLAAGVSGLLIVGRARPEALQRHRRRR